MAKNIIEEIKKLKEEGKYPFHAGISKLGTGPGANKTRTRGRSKSSS